MQRLVVAFPMYRQLPVSWFFNFICMDQGPVVGMVGTDGTILKLAFQQLTEMAFANYGTGWDRIVFFENDMIPPADAFARIAQYGPEHDIVGTMYFRHEPPHHVMACMHADQAPFFSPLTAQVTKIMVDNPALYEVDGVATGFMSVHRKVFEEWDPAVPLWDPAPPLLGHDLHFCNEAKKQGFKVWVDSGIGCGHLTQVPIGYEQSRDAEAQEPEVWFR